MIFSWNVSKHTWNLQSSVKASLASTKKKKKKMVFMCLCVGEWGLCIYKSASYKH